MIYFTCAFLFFSVSWGAPNGEVEIPSGEFEAFFKEKATGKEKVNSFYLDVAPVTKSDFQKFLDKNPQYQKANIISLYADKTYLADWSGPESDTMQLQAHGQEPVTYVSWFVARKYCASNGRRLPTLAEWEYAADINSPIVIDQILAWYSIPGDRPVGKVRQSKPNKFGLYDMHGLIWEWVEDFNSVMISSDSRSKGDRTDGLYCGGGSVSSKNAKDYATFMRYAFRSGLQGNFSVKNLGFRCARTRVQENK